MQGKGEVTAEILKIVHSQSLSKGANCEISFTQTELENTGE
jgi:hypothetical protein